MTTSPLMFNYVLQLEKLSWHCSKCMKPIIQRSWKLVISLTVSNEYRWWSPYQPINLHEYWYYFVAIQLTFNKWCSEMSFILCFNSVHIFYYFQLPKYLPLLFLWWRTSWMNIHCRKSKSLQVILASGSLCCWNWLSLTSCQLILVEPRLIQMAIQDIQLKYVVLHALSMSHSNLFSGHTCCNY